MTEAIRAVDRTNTTVSGTLGKLNLQGRGQTALGTAREEFSSAIGNAADAGLKGAGAALKAGEAAVAGAGAIASGVAVVGRPLAADARMGKEILTTLQNTDDGELVAQGLKTAPRFAKHVALAPKRVATSYQDAKKAVQQVKKAGNSTVDAARATKDAVKSIGRAGGNLMRGTRAAGSAAGPATRAAVRGVQSAGQTAGRVASNASTAAVRAVQNAVAAIRAAIAGLVTLVSSASPMMLIALASAMILMLVVTWIGWLVPLMSKGEKPTGEYGIAAPGPWGGYQNGRIPESELAQIPFSPAHYLRADAAAALVDLNTAYRAEFGVDIQVNDAYRDYDGQVAARDEWCNRGRCDRAAVPGTSNHGWALAVDLGGRINSWTSDEHQWMVEHAGEYGFINPDWAAPDQADEPWHWDFWGRDSAGNAGDVGADNDAQQYALTKINEGYYDAYTQLGRAQEWGCLKQLWTGESNWNHLAENPDSGAYGIPQSLPGDKMATFGDDWRTNYKTQINWGMDYILGRYETPCAALTFWNSKDPHWY